MTKNTFLHLFRSLLHRLQQWLDQMEQTPPRVQQRAWHRKEFHVPPMVIAFVSSFLLFVSLFVGSNPSWSKAISLAAFVVIFIALFSFYLRKDHLSLAKSDDAMALLSVIFFTTVICIKLFAMYASPLSWFNPFMTPIAIAPLLVTLLLHQRLGMVISFITAILFGMINEFSLPFTLVAMIGGATMVATVGRARTAHDVWRSGLLTGAAQAVVVVFLGLNLRWISEAMWMAVVGAFLSGIISAVFSLGARPFLEGFFSRTSNLRLLELSDVNHPLLRQMSLEAPGTFHHSLIVASLAEDAANAIGANGLLCRVGAYFHDIGKMVKAEYFIENQGAFGNPHDQVSPSLSKLIITSHVKEGLALAQTNKLDQHVMDFIPQHHGTSQIEYFYRKALKLEENEEEREDIDEEEYRYPGPKPQSREAGIVMMADSVEAASRTLEEPNHQRYKDLVYKIVNKKLFDGQMDETSLTLGDLHTIAERFTATLTSIHHSRVPYPETAPSEKGDRDELTPPG